MSSLGGTFACRPVYDVTIVKHEVKGQLDEAESGRR